MIRSPHDPIGRRALPHDPPHFIGTSNAIFFMTICRQPKGTNHLCHSQTAKILFDATRFYQEQHYWGVPLLLLMPDHLHMLASFGPDLGMKRVIANWKRYTARNDESFDEKAAYILENPVRAGLAHRVEDWPYQLQLR